MRVLAIDQSYTKSGAVILEDNKMIHFELFKTTKDDDVFKRAWDIAEHFKQVATDFNVDLVALEGLAFGGIGNATRDLAGLQFTITTRFRFVENINVVIISPGQVKKVATGKGNAKKEMLLELLPKDIHKKFYEIGVRKTTGLLDLTDAYWIARTTFEKMTEKSKS